MHRSQTGRDNQDQFDARLQPHQSNNIKAA